MQKTSLFSTLENGFCLLALARHSGRHPKAKDAIEYGFALAECLVSPMLLQKNQSVAAGCILNQAYEWLAIAVDFLYLKPPFADDDELCQFFSDA